jgi:hypothetical protein
LKRYSYCFIITCYVRFGLVFSLISFVVSKKIAQIEAAFCNKLIQYQINGGIGLIGFYTQVYIQLNCDFLFCLFQTFDGLGGVLSADHNWFFENGKEKYRIRLTAHWHHQSVHHTLTYTFNFR